MDRRRILLLVFVALVVAAAGDIYINTLNIFENFAQGFSFEVKEAEPRLTVERTVTRDVADIEKLFMDQQDGMIVVVGDSADQITVTSVIEIFAGDDEAAEAFANGLRLELDTKDGVLVPKLSEGPRHRISRIKTHWHIQVPQHLAIEIENRFGSIAVAGVDAPVELRGFGVMEAENIAGPVTVYNSLGTVKVIGVLGDTFVKSTVGTVELANIIGNVELVSSTVDSSIRDVSGRVTVEGILGSILVERVDGAVSVRAGTGSVNIRDARSRIDVQAEIANVVVLPGAPAPIDVTVAQGAVRFNIPSELLAEYRFDLDADEIIGLERIQSSGAQQGGVTDAHLVKATVRRGEIAVN